MQLDLFFPKKKRFVLFLLSLVKLAATVLIVLYNDDRLIMILLLAIVISLALTEAMGNNIKPKPGDTEKKGCCGRSAAKVAPGETELA